MTADAPSPPSPTAAPVPGWRQPRAQRRLALVLATLLYVAAVWVPYQDVIRAGLGRTLPIYPRIEALGGPKWGLLTIADAQWVATGIARNARTLGRDPLALFDLEACYPAVDALALCEPMITLGLLGVPLAWLTDDPLLIFNIVVISLMILSGLAMFLLVRDWTGSDAAASASALAAGFMYAYLPVKTYNIVHVYVDDTLWLVIALYCVRRLFAGGGGGYALAAGLAAGLQAGTSFYPMLGSALVSLPILAWLLRDYGVRRLPVAWTAVAAALLLLLLAAFLGPYVGEHATAASDRNMLFAEWSYFAPGGRLYEGWLLLLTSASALVLGRRRTLAEGIGDPRPALAFSCAALVVLSLGPNSGWFNAYGALAHLIPPMTLVRAPGAVVAVAHPLACILAGLGMAGLIRLTPDRHRHLAAIALVALAIGTTYSVRAGGQTGTVIYEAVRARPSPEALAFLDRLAELGVEGPLVDSGRTIRAANDPAPPLMLGAYHGMRTNVCHSSIRLGQIREIESHLAKLNDPRSLRALHAMGFRVLLARPGSFDEETRRVAAMAARAARSPRVPLKLLYEDAGLAAYALQAP